MMVSETVASFKHLPPEVQKHLDVLETYIGDTDGKDTVMWQTDPPNTCIDDGTIDASEAVTAFNGIVVALTAALSDQAGGWQDISMAPKDGTTIQVWHKVWKCPVSARYIAGRKSACKWVEATITTEWPDDAFTHWQPLPAPPPSSTAGEVG